MLLSTMLTRRVLPAVVPLLLLGACGPARMLLSVEPAEWAGSQSPSLVSHPDSVYVRFQFVRAEAAGAGVSG